MAVPKPFLKEHFNSKRHKTFKKIIDVSLERLKRIIDHDVFEDSYISDSVYFCSSCVAVVDIHERILHETSIAHKNGLKVESILNNFLDLYDDGEKSNNNCDNYSGNIQYNNKVPVDIDKEPIVNNTAANDKMKIEEVTNNSLKSEKIECMSNEIAALSKVHESSKNLEAYVDFLINTTNFKNIKIVQNYNLEMVTTSGVNVKVAEFKFNSIKNLSKTLYRCILCSEIMHKNMKWEHLYGEKHVQFVTIPFEDENCMRRVSSLSKF